VCRDRLSYQRALDVMLGYGLKRSKGWLSKTIAGFDCGERCQGAPAEPEPQLQPPAEPAAVHNRRLRRRPRLGPASL